jgi:uncharacterized protein (TIGR00255 family)
MKSMTGYGRGECSRDGHKVTIEVSSVNRKQSEITIALPRDLEALESLIRDEINQRIARGRLTVKVGMHAAGDSGAGRARVNESLARAYHKEFQKLGKTLKLKSEVSLDQILRAPGVLEVEEELTDAEAYWPVVQKALAQALDALIKMREREGAHLAKDLSQRVKTIRGAVERVQTQAPQVQVRYRENLLTRIRNAGIEVPGVEDERLVKEVVYFADRSDISEELTRLLSHFQQFEDCVKSKEPVGRPLDFLSQEMNREINTIGSKASDAVISREVVLVKAELEKFREQVQNVE